MGRLCPFPGMWGVCQPALARLRELATAGVHDRQIAERLAAEGFVTDLGDLRLPSVGDLISGISGDLAGM